MGARLLRAAGSPGQEAPCGGAGVSLQMDSHNLSLLEGARGLRRERLPGSFGQAQLAAGGSNQGGVVRNMCETCGGGSEFFLGKINFLLDSTPQKSANAVALATKVLIRRTIDSGKASTFMTRKSP